MQSNVLGETTSCYEDSKTVQASTELHNDVLELSFKTEETRLCHKYEPATAGSAEQPVRDIAFGHTQDTGQSISANA